ncbi:MAG: hypothetical protein ABFC96_01960 [Thermoguttaceae bacterium]
MRTRFSLAVVLSVAAVLGSTMSARGSLLSDLGIRPSRFAALAARQSLRDEVAVATADGRLDRYERAEILGDAKDVLSPAEYKAFKRAMDQRWPMEKPKTAVKHVAKVVERPSVVTPAVDVRLSDGSSRGLVIPTGVLLPD